MRFAIQWRLSRFILFSYGEGDRLHPTFADVFISVSFIHYLPLRLFMALIIEFLLADLPSLVAIRFSRPTSDIVALWV
jgi:hypothetical protein